MPDDAGPATVLFVAGRVVVVFADGPGRATRVSLPSGASVIAADGGAEQAHELGLAVDLVIGDLDSLSPATLAALEQSGTRVERHPVAKDASDLELALDAALALEPGRIVVIGGGAGRLDHLAGELLLLAADAYASVPVDAQLGAAAVHVVRGERTLTGHAGRAGLALRRPRAGCRGRDRGAALSASWRDARPRLDPGALERLHRRRGSGVGRARSAARRAP